MDLFDTKAALWTGRVMSGVMTLLFIVDGVTKLIPIQPVVAGMKEAGIALELARPIGLAVLVPAVLYAIPQTAVLGAVLLTGFLGGAMAAHLRDTTPQLPHDLFILLLGILTWLGLWLRQPRLRALMPWTR